ncbi:hypothetical protein WMY93_013862 [Mugilogobius chulae]|uniref:LIM zinc-binding domain-containing protein n=1 Tax=Mugilogobius chulae TaxID=88201 RepID=A0AAW0PDJ7_9GOBI
MGRRAGQTLHSPAPLSPSLPLQSEETQVMREAVEGQCSAHIVSASAAARHPFCMVDIIFSSSFLDDMGDHSKKKSGFAMCVGCGSQIHDQYILRVSPDLEWHAACLKCAECSQYLDETCTCFVRDGKTYCKRDYVRLFGIKCAKCNLGFSSSDLPSAAARGRVFSAGRRAAVPRGPQSIAGQERHGKPAEPGTSALQQTATPRRPSHGAAGSASEPCAQTVGEDDARADGPEREAAAHTADLLQRKPAARRAHEGAAGGDDRPEPQGHQSLVPKQALQDKKKSILMKQLQQQQHSDKTNLQGLTGTPLVAGSPIRHESTVQGNPVEVQTYQPPWKALSEFALQSDLDQPAFQQLVSFSESGSLGNSSGSDVTSLSSQLPDTPNSMVPSPVET